MDKKQDEFLRRKKQQLEKEDRSLRQGWDKKIKKLCEKINACENYYTTSSCSGRGLLLMDSSEKRDDLFVKVWHDKINLNDIKEALSNVKTNEIIYFKHEPCILHAACRTMEDAGKLVDMAIVKAGWKRSGIISFGKRIIAELNSTEKLEFPIMSEDKILVDDNFLSLIAEEANKKIKISWERIERMEKLIEYVK